MLDQIPQLVYNSVCTYLGTNDLRKLSKLYPQQTRNYLLDNYDMLDIYFSYRKIRRKQQIKRKKENDTKQLRDILLQRIYDGGISTGGATGVNIEKRQDDYLPFPDEAYLNKKSGKFIGYADKTSQIFKKSIKLKF